MTQPTFQELLTSQEARFTNEQLEAWAGLDKEWPLARLAAALLAERKAREVEVGRLKTALVQIACEADEIHEASMSDGCDGPALLDFAKSAANIAHSALVDRAIRQAMKETSDE